MKNNHDLIRTIHVFTLDFGRRRGVLRRRHIHFENLVGQNESHFLLFRLFRFDDANFADFFGDSAFCGRGNGLPSLRNIFRNLRENRTGPTGYVCLAFDRSFRGNAHRAFQQAHKALLQQVNTTEKASLTLTNQSPRAAQVVSTSSIFISLSRSTKLRKGSMYKMRKSKNYLSIITVDNKQSR